MLSQRVEERLTRVLAHVREHGPVTARDVARDVFGGTGGTRTSSRQVAYTDLRRLMGRGLVWRRPADLDGYPGYLYEAREARQG